MSELFQFLPRDASAERVDATVSRLSVCLSVCNDQVPCSNTLEFFENTGNLVQWQHPKIGVE